jgi:hypothetical protein
MILRYQWFIQRLNNIRKVCRLHNVTMVSLDLRRGLAAEVRVRFRLRLLSELAQASTGTTKEHHDASTRQR